MTQSNFTEYLERNEAFAATDAKDTVPEIPFIPHKQLCILTCMDPRTEPAAIVGSEFGEALIARNIAGRVTPEFIKGLAWVVHLHENLTPDADWFEVAIIHHTDCGSTFLVKDELRAGYVARGGWDDKTSLETAVIDLDKTLTEDVQKLRTAPELQSAIDKIKIGGYAYDVKTGKLTTVVEPR